MQKPILILFGTHGDEYCLKQCLEYIHPKYSALFDVLDVNEQAIIEGKRCVLHNMNRTAPGDASSCDYELRRWAYIQQVIQKYSIVIDVHGTDSDTGSFILLPKATPAHVWLSVLFWSKNIVLWQSGIHKDTWPIVAFHPLGLEIETWPMNNLMIQQLSENFNTFFDNYTRQYSFSELLFLSQTKTIYSVTARLDVSSPLVIPKCDFQKIIIDTQPYYTLLTDNPYSDTKCYLMNRLEVSWLLVNSLSYFSAPVKDIF